MGSSSSKESKAGPKTSARHTSDRPVPGQFAASQSSPAERGNAEVYTARRGSRPDLTLLSLVRDRDSANAAAERPRETKQEREARKAEKERQARLKERERSLREEGVDGGYLVTLGTYTGAEDFNKGIVRQLQIERRLAPFWKGLNDHSESWTEVQLVAAVRGLPIPAADEVPPPGMIGTEELGNPRASDHNINRLTVPISSRSQSYESGTSARLSASHPAFSSSGPASPVQSTAQMFRGRAKTLASLATGSKSHSPDLTPQEVKLAKDPYVNGQPIEAYLYKDATECPICFLYYPPYLNKTRCCDQPICSECFVQIKRPDPHPPEHEQPGQSRPPEEEAETLVSEVAACPFCVTPEFGVSYDAPPFRRGLAYAHSNPLKYPTSAMSSSSSLGTSTPGRRRATSLSATSPHVITTDRVRPDWAKKLADARAHALRRSAAATALHNAAYVLGTQPDGSRVNLVTFGRRRRTLFGDSPGASGSGTPRGPDGLPLSPYGNMLRAGIAGREGEDSNDDLFPARGSSRRTRVDDLEDLMMMEAIRLSLVAEEDRKKKEEKEARKEAKQKAKDDKKEAKQAEKLAKKGGSGSMYNVGSNESTSTWASTSMARSTSNIGMLAEENVQGKGKAPAQDFAGFNPLTEPSSTLNTEMREPHDMPSSSLPETSQRYLEESRAHLQPSPIPTGGPPRGPSHLRQLSNASSAASSLASSAAGSPSNTPSANPSGLDLAQETPPTHEPMLNFRSLAAVIGSEGNDTPETSKSANEGSEHVESTVGPPPAVPSPSGAPNGDNTVIAGTNGDKTQKHEATESEDQISVAPPPTQRCEDADEKKGVQRVDVWDSGHARETTR